MENGPGPIAPTSSNMESIARRRIRKPASEAADLLLLLPIRDSSLESSSGPTEGARKKSILEEFMGGRYCVL